MGTKAENEEKPEKRLGDVLSGRLADLDLDSVEEVRGVRDTRE
ncbi:hypothetical protein ACFQE1_03795 [Halobium palmae]|uniref:Uncharacterized protein n=1 Tax=Halobium palmae TaxID=1776492 RepID=A0ABD5RWB0_9EURY